MTTEHILVVDDDAGLAATVGASLRRSGFSCEISRNSTDALQRFADGARFDLVLLDVVLRHGDGLTLLETLKETCPGVPVVMISPGCTISASRYPP